jgi:cytochrome c biogenesis protein CcmG, thiol:disulfide interchange protein DsbE
MKKAIVITIAVLLCGFVLFVLKAGFGGNPHEVPFMMLGKPAPNFTSKDLRTGEQVNFDSYKGKPVVINFWATFCKPCKDEHPILEWAKANYGDRVEFIGVIADDNEENTRRFIAENGGSWRQLFDPHSTVAVDYGTSGVPETFFIDRNGVIKDRVPYAFSHPQQIAQRIEELLK